MTRSSLVKPIALADMPDHPHTGDRRNRAWLGGLLAMALAIGLVAGGAAAIESRQAAIEIEGAARTSAEALNAELAPVLANVPTDALLSAETKRSVDAVLHGTPAGKDVVTIKIWDTSGRIVHSNRAWLDGRVFPVNDELAAALRGQLVGDLDNLDDEESETEQDVGIPLLEVYAPVRKSSDQPITAVAEYYTKATALAERLERNRLVIWSLAGLVIAGIAAVLGAWFWRRALGD